MNINIRTQARKRTQDHFLVILFILFHVSKHCFIGIHSDVIQIDFLDIYREEEALRLATADMEGEEARRYVLNYYGW